MGVDKNMNEYTCKSCGASFERDTPERFCMQCQIVFGLVTLHDTEERNKIEQMRTRDNIRRYGDAFSAVLEQILPSRRDPNYSKLVARDDYGHHLCPWCGSPGSPHSSFYVDNIPTRFRIVCASTDCAAAPTLNWSATEADAWQLWDTRK